MIHTDAELFNDIEKIKQIPIVTTMLDVICKTTGMGFAAIARVTEERWIACSVHDEIDFGLKEGGELMVATTICNEIRDSRNAVVIDEVKTSEIYVNHHTPKMYGFQSYISFPIIEKNGELFGTICAIDPNPASLNNSKTIGMFSLFAELISFHLHNLDLTEHNNQKLQSLNRRLTDSIDENRQYQYISSHNLQEPLRKIRVFSGMLVDATNANDIDKAKDLAVKIDSNAQKFSMMIRDLSGFSELNQTEYLFETVDLNRVVADVHDQLAKNIEEKEAVLKVGDLPQVKAIKSQIEQLFFHLINNALKFSKKAVASVVKISCKEVIMEAPRHNLAAPERSGYFEIRIEDNGIGIDKSQLERIFDIFMQSHFDKVLDGGGIGLSYCRKILRNHRGSITAESEPGRGTTFIIMLPR